MPRRWYWDWQENALATLRLKLPTKYREASVSLATSRNHAAQAKNVTIPGPPPKLEAAPIPTHTLPRSDEATPNMTDTNSNGSTDDETPLPMTAMGNIHPIKFAEEVDPADQSRTRTIQGCADLVDLMLIKAYNGGAHPYCRFSQVGLGAADWSKGWKFERVSSKYYTDRVIKRLDENHGRGGSNE